MVAGWTAIAVVVGLSAAEGLAQQPVKCRRQPIEPCVKRHGRLSTQNGISPRIWLVGTKRMVHPENTDDFLPEAALRYTQMTSDDHSYIFGDFTICPVEPDLPGHLRGVCVTTAETHVIQPLRRRLLSTWPTGRGR